MSVNTTTSPYLITRVSDGLGNQLFQYAVARAFARALNYELRLDLRWFDEGRERKYLLKHFAIDATLATPRELPMIGHKGFFRQVCKAWLKANGRLIVSNGSSFEALSQRIKPECYFFGYWQWPHFFLQDSDHLRRELRLVAAPTFEAEAMIAKMQDSNSVSVHVRRGDYFSNLNFAKAFGICGAEYYNMAAEKMAKLLGQKPTFYVFSDDLSWAQTHLKLPGETVFVAMNGEAAPHEDLRLMSCCKHHIIANSTFSWWGAWLNPDPEKIVVAPRHWLAGEHSSRSPLLLPEFVLVENGLR